MGQGSIVKVMVAVSLLTGVTIPVLTSLSKLPKIVKSVKGIPHDLQKAFKNLNKTFKAFRKVGKGVNSAFNNLKKVGNVMRNIGNVVVSTYVMSGVVVPWSLIVVTPVISERQVVMSISIIESLHR